MIKTDLSIDNRSLLLIDDLRPGVAMDRSRSVLIIDLGAVKAIIRIGDLETATERAV